MNQDMKPVTIIGMGLTARDLTDAHKEIIQKADILIGGKRHLAYFEDLGVVKKEITKDLQATIAYIQDQMISKRIVVLTSGDPLFYGIGSVLVRALGSERVEVLPNISSIAAAFAKIKEPWSNVRVISLHGRNHEMELLQALKRHEQVAVFTDPERNPAWLADFLISKGVINLKMGVFEKLGTLDEKIGWYQLDIATDLNFADPNVVILKRKPEANSSPQTLYMGLSEDLFVHEGGLITKTEVRAVTLAKLKLLPYHTLWDLGAGSGSVSIEAAVFLERGRIIAVEQKAERIDQIKANIRRFGVNNIEALQAVMPDGLSSLPTPDRVFIGGGGRDLEQIISKAASLMQPGGVMVINTVLMANLETSQKTMRKNGFNTEVVQVQVLRSKAMPWSERFETLNPVWIISGQKTE